MANVEMRYAGAPRRLPVAASRGARPAPREPVALHRPAPQRPAICRITAGQLIRSACLVAICFGISYLPRGEKLAPQGSVVEAANLKF